LLELIFSRIKKLSPWEAVLNILALKVKKSSNLSLW